MLGDYIHRHFAEVEVCANSRSCRDTGCREDIQNDLHGKVMGRQLVGGEVVGDIHEHLVDGVDDDVLRCDILHVNLIDAGAVLHVVRHARRRDDEVNGKGRVLLQLREEVRRALQPSPRRVMLPSSVCFFDALPDFKQSPTPGDTVALERRCDRKADGLVRPALIRNDEVCVQRV